MDHAITRGAGATPRAVGEFQGFIDGEPSVVWADRKNMPQVGDKLFAIPARAAVPRSWSILLTSANHGTVGPVGSTFPHAGEKHERVQVMEIVEAGAPPAPGVDLPGLVRLELTNEQIAAGAIVRCDHGGSIGRSAAIEVWDAMLGVAPIAAQAGQVAVPEGFVLMPRRLTAENGAKGLLSGEFAESCSVNCPECDGSGEVDEGIDCGECSGEGVVQQRVLVEWDTIKRIYDMAVEHLAAAPAAPAQAKPLPAPAVPTLVEPTECWSHNEEDFNAQSLGELVDTHELAPGATVWVGEAVHPKPSSLFSTDWLIENMGEAAYDIAGEHAGEDYPNVSDEQVAELEALVVGWIAKCAPPTFWTVKNVRPYVLTAEDCGAQASTAGGRQEGGDHA